MYQLFIETWIYNLQKFCLCIAQWMNCLLLVFHKYVSLVVIPQTDIHGEDIHSEGMHYKQI